MTIKKSNNYFVGICSITEIVGAELKHDFDLGEPIEVTEEQFNAINDLSWCEEIKEDEHGS